MLARDGIDLRDGLLDDTVGSWLPTIGAQDSFEHWLYAEAPEDARPADLDAAWRQVSARFEPWVNWTGLEAEQGFGWRRQLLFFLAPFYSLDYALANLGALQIARRAEVDPAGAWSAYRAALSPGGSVPPGEVYEAAGARLPLSRSVVREAAAGLA